MEAFILYISKYCAFSSAADLSEWQRANQDIPTIYFVVEMAIVYSIFNSAVHLSNTYIIIMQDVIILHAYIRIWPSYILAVQAYQYKQHGNRCKSRAIYYATHTIKSEPYSQ